MKRSINDIVWLSILAFFWAIQAAVVLEQVLGFWQAQSMINDILLPEIVGRVAFKWDLLIYISFIGTALVSGKILFKYYQRTINCWLVIFEGIVAFLMVSALFKMLVYDNSPQLAQWSLWSLICISVLGKIFYPEIRRIVEISFQWLSKATLAPYANVCWVIIILLMIYMPDLERVSAMIFMGEYFHHWDAFIMAPGFASLCGQLLSVDVFSEYGIGLPVILVKLSRFFGGFNYVSILSVMMWFSIIYFILVYYFVRYWLKSVLIAGVAFLLVFRLQMFHYGVSPLIWSVPSASPVRFGLDILWLAALAQHIRSGKSWWLILAGIYSGFALYYMTSTGLCVMATYYSYLVALIALPLLRRQWWEDQSQRMMYFISWVMPVVSAILFLGLAIGTKFFQEDFWRSLLSYMATFSHAGAMPMFESLKYRYFWSFIMSMVVLFTYLATLLYLGVSLYLEKCPRERILVVLFCIYGLATLQYYVVRSAVTSYYVGILPFILIVCFWFVRCLEFMPLVWQKRLKVTALVLSFYALLTNQNYLAYPNMMSFSRNPMTDNLVIQRFPDRRGYFNSGFKYETEADKLPVNDLGTTEEDRRTEDDFKSDAELVSYYHSQFNFQEDADLIRELTRPKEEVALISSFEVKILLQANRQPFFYHFPLIFSRPMAFRTFPPDASRLPSYLKDTINQLEEKHPLYVFMEKVFLQDEVPASYKEKNSNLLAIIAYVKAHYQPMSQGKYLVVMKRNE